MNLDAIADRLFNELGIPDRERPIIRAALVQAYEAGQEATDEEIAEHRRQSLANEIRGVLKTYGKWAPERPSDLISAVGQVCAALAQAENSGIDKAIAYIREQRSAMYGDSFDILPPIIEGLEKMKGKP